MSYTTLENPDAPSLVVIDDTREIIVISGSIGPKGDSGTMLSNLQDVDNTGLEQDSVLMYDSSSSKWKPSKKLENHLINAGFF